MGTKSRSIPVGSKHSEMKELVLASTSPRRKELLESLHFAFSIQAAAVDETLDAILPISEAIQKIAALKAEAIAIKNKEAIVIGADTLVVYQGNVLGKPKDEQTAFSMLKMLSGQTHQVLTGVAIHHCGRTMTFVETTAVTFYELRDEDIKQYLGENEYLDKAGAYGIQGYGKVFVKAIDGDYYNVVGLPIAKVYRILKAM